MHIAPTTHEHGLSAKVYTYDADYQVGPDAIIWRSTVRHAEEPARAISGTIPITSPAGGVLAEKAVHDAIVKQIDTLGPAPPRDEAAPVFAAVRTPLHDALEAFVGRWHSEGTWHGALAGSAATVPTATHWRSAHSARWRRGRYFVVHDEQGHAGTEPLDILTVIGVDAPSGKLFAHCFDSRGLQRRYA